MVSIKYLPILGMLAILPLIPLTAQEVVLDETVSEEVFSRRFGPNGQHFVYRYFSWYIPVSRLSEQVVKPFASSEVDFGVLYKYRLNNYLSTGGDFRAEFVSYRMKNMNTLQPYQLLPEWEKERVTQINITLAWFGRVNFGKRGNHLGKYLDAGVFGGYSLFNSHIFLGEDKATDTKVNTQRNYLPYLHRWAWGFHAGFGSNYLKISARYRMSDYLIMGKVNGGDLPKLMIGLEIGIPEM
ncbi:MAG TPA: hypothetical protein P5228_12410 [Bacteroidales bacterium]|nr:hypothetical protein [Bacteroidales bacterium]HRZ49632.1 hypothetical protein [Bacteroidales bacterium]